MGALAIRLSSMTNGVSQRHGGVVSEEWGDVIGGPAKAITNGMHPQTWVGRAVSRLYHKTVGEVWEQQVIDHGSWEKVRDIPAEELWKAHQTQKTAMLRRLRSRLREQLARHGQSPSHLRWLDEQLDPQRLTIVFARRFATYKRAGLLFSDPQRVRAILTNPERPVQVVFAGKAHPADREGQGLIKWVFDMSNSPDLQGHVWFIENYDMALGADLVRGADVWLNNPVASEGGQRHVRHEVRRQRRHQPQCARRVVGRGLQREERVGVLGGVQLGRRRRRHPLPPARVRGRADVLRA